MNRYQLKHLGISTSTPQLESGKVRYVPPPLPAEHPCYGCVVLTVNGGVPYCFLPRCDREIFEQLEDSHAHSDCTQ